MRAAGLLRGHGPFPLALGSYLSDTFPDLNGSLRTDFAGAGKVTALFTRVVVGPAGGILYNLESIGCAFRPLAEGGSVRVAPEAATILLLATGLVLVRELHLQHRP